jgi:O-antigen/teichoic acid export membrane protein
VAVLAGAPLLPRLLGPGYEESACVLRWLSVLPLLKAVQYLCGDAMTGADLQRRRTAIQGGLALANVALNILLDPVFGWRGAAAATLVSDTVLAAALWAGAFTARRGGPGRSPDGIEVLDHAEDLPV